MRIVMMILGMAMFLSACDGKDGSVDVAPLSKEDYDSNRTERNLTAEKEKLDRHSSLWASHGISTYRFSYVVRCFCYLPIDKTILVEDQAVTYAWDEAEQKSVDESDFSTLYTIEELFDSIDETISSRPDGLSVEYDPEFGYPTSISVDQSFAGADDEYRIGVSSFDAGAHSGTQFKLTRSQDIWNARHISDYIFTQTINCEDCDFSGQVAAVIESETVISASNTEGDVLLEETALSAIKSIAQIFEIIQLNIDNNAALIEVEYDDALAFPVRLRIDVDDSSTADNIEYVIQDVEYDVFLAAQNKLDINKLKWEAVNTGDYEFRLETSELTLKGSHIFIQVVADTLALDDEPLFYPKINTWRDIPYADLDQLMTVDDMFFFIQNAIDEGVAIPNVEYHPEDGYPRALSNTNPDGEEFTWRVFEFFYYPSLD